MSDEIGAVEVDVEADFDKFERQLLRMLSRMAARANLHVDVDAQTKNASAHMAAWRKLMSKSLDIKVKLQAKSLSLVSAQLASLTGVSQLVGSFSHFNDVLLGLHEAILPIGLIGSLIAGAAGPLVTLFGSLVSSTVEFTKALFPGLGAALAALPALFGAGALSVMTFKFAMADVDKVLGDTLKKYSSIQKIVSKNFWKEAEGPVRSLLENSLEPLEEGFGTLSTSIGNFTGNFAESIEKAFTPKVITTFFDQVSAAFDKFSTGATDPLAGILLTLTQFGGGLLPGIAKNITNLLDRFDKFLRKAYETGALNDALSTLGGLFKSIGSGLASIGRIFNAVAKASQKAGVAAFPFEVILGRIADVMNGKAFQQGLTKFFRQSKKGAEGMSVALEPLGDLLAAIAPIIGRFIKRTGRVLGVFFATLFDALNDPEVLANFQSLLDGLTKVFENLTPAVGPFVDKLSEMMHFAGILADVVSKTLAVAIIELAPVVSELLKAFEPLVMALGNFIQGSIVQAAPLLLGVAEAAAGLVDGITLFVEALDTPVVKFVTGLLLDFFVTAVKGALNLAGGIFKIVGGLLKILSGDFSGLEDIWEGLKQGLKGAFQLFITLFAPAKILKLLKPIGSLLGKFVPKIFSTLLPKVGGLLGKLGKLILDLITKGLDALPGLGGFLIRKFTSGAITAVTQGIPTIAKAIMDGLIRGVKALIGGFLSQFIDPIIDGVKNLLGINSPSKVFADIGGFLVQGLINGVKALLGLFIKLWVVPFIKIGKFIRSKMAEMLANIVQILISIHTFFTEKFEAIKTAVAEKVGAIRDKISEAFTAAKEKVISIFTSIKDAVSEKLSSIMNFITDLPGKIKEKAKDFLNAGSKLGSQIIEGIKAGLGAVGDLIGNIGDDIQAGLNKVLGLPKDIGFSVLGKDIKFTIPGFAEGVRNFSGGLAVVGERGPELVRLPAGSDVYSNPESRRMGMTSNSNANPAPMQSSGNLPSNDGLTVNIDKLTPHNYSEFERQMLAKSRAAAIGGRRIA